MQNIKSTGRTMICPYCGSPKLTDWKDLDSDQRLVAARFLEGIGASPEDFAYCKRCLKPAERPDSGALSV